MNLLTLIIVALSVRVVTVALCIVIVVVVTLHGVTKPRDRIRVVEAIFGRKRLA